MADVNVHSQLSFAIEATFFIVLLRPANAPLAGTTSRNLSEMSPPKSQATATGAAISHQRSMHRKQLQNACVVYLHRAHPLLEVLVPLRCFDRGREGFLCRLKTQDKQPVKLDLNIPATTDCLCTYGYVR